MVMLATSISTSSGMLPVLPDTTMSCADVTPLLPVLLQVCSRITGVKALYLILLATSWSVAVQPAMTAVKG